MHLIQSDCCPTKNFPNWKAASRHSTIEFQMFSRNKTLSIKNKSEANWISLFTKLWIKPCKIFIRTFKFVPETVEVNRVMNFDRNRYTVGELFLNTTLTFDLDSNLYHKMVVDRCRLPFTCGDKGPRQDPGNGKMLSS